MTYASNSYIRLDQLIDGWEAEVLSGEPPIHYDLGGGLEDIHLGPGIVALLGGAPGMGKTAFAMQCVTNAMLFNDQLRVCVANVEMPPQRLLDRQLSRLSGVPLNDIQNRSLDAEQRVVVADAFDELSDIADRLVFVQNPMTLDNVAMAADSIGADLIVLDYIQRIKPSGEHNDKRGSVDATMDSVRQFASAGCCVLALSAVGRSKDAQGRSSYAGEGLSLASFRESSELEFGADDAYMLVPTAEDAMHSDDEVVDVTLRHLKSRYGKPSHVNLSFDRSVQHFAIETTAAPLESLSGLWEQNNER